MNHNFVFKQIFFRKTACIVFLEKVKDFTEDGGGEKLMAQSQVRDFDTRERLMTPSGRHQFNVHKNLCKIFCEPEQCLNLQVFKNLISC